MCHFPLHTVFNIGFPWSQMVKNLPAVQGIWVRSLGWDDPLKKEMSTHSSILAWRIPWTEESGRLQSMGLQRVRYNWATNTHMIIFKSTIEKVVLTICILLCKTFLELSHFCKTDTLYSLNNSPFPLHLSPWQPPFYFLFLRVGPL